MRKTIAVIAVVVVVLVAVAMLMHVFPFNTGNGSPAHTPTSPPSTGTNTSPPTTTTPGYARFSTLNGTLNCLGGKEITRELWMKMRDYKANDPAIAEYIEWLREALSPQPHKALNVPWYPPYKYYWFNDHRGVERPSTRRGQHRKDRIS